MCSGRRKNAGTERELVRRVLDEQHRLLKAGYSFSGHERDFLALNLKGREILDISGVSGADSISDGRAAVYADFDNDGDLDIFLRSQFGQCHRLFRNEIGQDNAYVRITLVGVRSGRDAFGAIVRVRSSSGILTKVKSGGSGYLSQSDPRLLFGLGRDDRTGTIEVRWPSGAVQVFDGVAVGQSIAIVEGKETITVLN